MVEFLEGASGLLVFYSIAIIASLVLVVQIILAAFGFDDIDSVDLDVGNGLSFLSLRSLTGFFGGFGWTGVIMLENEASLGAAIAAGVVAGLLLMVSIAYLMKLIYSLGESGTIDFRNAVGQVGTVYMRVPASQSGPGQVRVMVQGRLTMVSAFTNAAEPIPAEKKIRVTAMVDSRTVLVEPLGGTGGED